MSNTMNRRQAVKVDTSFYAEWSSDDREYGVFGDYTGFCYGLFCDMAGAEELADELNRNPSTARAL